MSLNGYSSLQKPDVKSINNLEVSWPIDDIKVKCGHSVMNK